MQTQAIVLTLTIAWISGCFADVPGEDQAEPSADDGPGAVPATLLSAQKRFTNPVPCAPGCIPVNSPDDPEVGNFTLTQAAQDVWVNFTRVASGTTFFADNCRLFEGEGERTLVDQAAFSDAQYGQVGTTGTCVLHFDQLDPGLYRAVYSTDQFFPTGTHDVTVNATARL